MTRSSVEALIRALNGAGVRYLIAGGLAVVAHGHVRFTADVDLALALDEDNLRRAVGALEGLGYRPRAPVPFSDFLDAANRARWVSEKSLTVFSLSSPEHPATEVDLFVTLPFDFEDAHAEAAALEVVPGLPATFVSRRLLLEMKRQAGRPQDLEDLRRLEGAGDPPA